MRYSAIVTILLVVSGYMLVRTGAGAANSELPVGKRIAQLRHLAGWSAATVLAALFTVLDVTEGWSAVFGVPLMALSMLMSSAISRVGTLTDVGTAPSLGAAFLMRLRRDGETLLLVATRTYRAIAPTGWREFRLRLDLLLENLFSLRVFIGTYGIALAAVPLLFAVLAVLAFGSAQGTLGALIRTYANYGLLFCASCLTISLLTTVAVVAFLRAMGVIMWRPHYQRLVTSISTWSGIGAVLGAVAASLCPLVIAFLPGMVDTTIATEAAAITPQILFDLSAVGAGVGFVLGLVRSLYTVSQDAENLAYRVLFVPAIFTIVTTLFSRLELTPSTLLERVASAVAPSATPLPHTLPAEQAEAIIMADWKSALVLIADPVSGLVLPDATAWTTGVLITVGAVSITVFCISVIKRIRMQKVTEPALP